MGILNGAVRFRRFQVMGEAPQDVGAGFEQAIERHAFRDFSSGDEREQVMGWVGMDDWFDPNLHSGRWLTGRTVNLTLRIDTKRIPARFFKQECRKLEAEWKLKSGREGLTRAERDEVQTIVRKRLLERVIPACQGLDMSWELDRKEVLFWSTSDRACEVFRVLFERTFGRKLRPLFPYAAAIRLMGDEAGESLGRVVPTSFQPEGSP